MTNTYAINTTRNQEFTVEQDLIDLGVTPWVPRRLESRYVKEKREAVWYDRAYIPKLIFCVIPAIYWRDVYEMKHVLGRPMPLTERDIRGTPAHWNKAAEKMVPEVPGLATFRKAVEAEYQDMQRRKVNSEYQCQYAPGQALELLAGPFAGFRAEFQDVIRRAHQDYSKLRVEVQVFGRPTIVEVDPDKVRVYD